jgi:geranylgeranyl reductase family protein
MQYDVIFVGAGPAGSAAALGCVRSGLSVLILDRAEFPRDKPCGGGVSVRAAGLLDFDLSPVVERTITGMRFSWRQSSDFVRDYPRPVTYLTQRSRLDVFLLEKAIGAGAAFVSHAQVKDIRRTGREAEVFAGGAWYQGRSLVAADGANGVAARLAGIQTRLSLGVALEGNITPKEGVSHDWDAAMGFDMGDVPGGYGWLFPKGDHVNIGVGGWRSAGPTLRQRLDRLVRYYGFDPERLHGLRGHYLPVRLNGSRLVEGNALAVGDAAGLLDPLTGEGIYAAILSGQAAAKHLAAYLSGAAPSLAGYEDELRETLLRELDAGRTLHVLFHVTPRTYVRLQRRSPRVWRAVCKLLRGERSYLDVRRRLGPLWYVFGLAAAAAYLATPLRREASNGSSRARFGPQRASA